MLLLIVLVVVSWIDVLIDTLDKLIDVEADGWLALGVVPHVDDIASDEVTLVVGRLALIIERAGVLLCDVAKLCRADWREILRMAAYSE